MSCKKTDKKIMDISKNIRKDPSNYKTNTKVYQSSLVSSLVKYLFHLALSSFLIFMLYISIPIFRNPISIGFLIVFLIFSIISFFYMPLIRIENDIVYLKYSFRWVRINDYKIIGLFRSDFPMLVLEIPEKRFYKKVSIPMLDKDDHILHKYLLEINKSRSVGARP